MSNDPWLCVHISKWDTKKLTGNLNTWMGLTDWTSLYSDLPGLFWEQLQCQYL